MKWFEEPINKIIEDVKGTEVLDEDKARELLRAINAHTNCFEHESAGRKLEAIFFNAMELFRQCAQDFKQAKSCIANGLRGDWSAEKGKAIEALGKATRNGKLAGKVVRELGKHLRKLKSDVK